MTSKITKIFSVILLLILISIKANSQIIYTDINPDVTISEFGNGYALDFNNDGKIDLHIVLLADGGIYVMRIIPDANDDTNYVINEGGNDGGAKIINYTDEISESSNWYEIGSGWGDLLYGHWDSSGNYGYWSGNQEDKYLGIKFKIGTNFYNAWIQITTNVYATDNMDFTIKAFAYNSVANENILAGDEGNGVSIPTIKPKDFFVYPSITKGFFNFSENINLKNIEIYDILGNRQNFASSKNTIDISNLKAGIYFVKYYNKIKKITKQ